MPLFGPPEEVYRDLLHHYQNAGLNVELLGKESPEALGEETAYRFSGREFDLVIPKFTKNLMYGGGGGFGPSVGKDATKMSPVVRFHHIVKGLRDRTPQELNSKTKEKRKGLISKVLVDVEWEGGKLAGLLNSDSDLKAMILETGTAPLEVEADAENDCIRIIHRTKVKMVVERGGVLKKTVAARASGFPPTESFDVVDRIAGHVKTV